ncbi:MAG: ADP-heptose:LPS heptosyltransferase, partial [Planctomycetota bacterium]
MKSLQTLDKLLGRVACLVLQPLLWIQRAMAGLRSRNRAKTSVEQVLLIKFWGIGSLQLLTPACQLVRGQVPGARLTLLTLEENADFARGLRDPHDGSPAFDDIMILDVQSNWIGLPYRILRALWQLRRRGFDAVYDFEFFTRFSAIVSFASGAPERHGFHAPGIWRGGVHTRRVPFNRYWHVARNFSALAGQTIERDILPDELSPYGVLSEDECSIDAALAGWLKQGPLIVVNPNAGRLSLERRWPISRFARLAEDLVSQRGANVALIGSNSEVAYTRQAIDMIGGSSQARVRSFAGTLSMGELCALLQRADLVVTNDSGPMH